MYFIALRELFVWRTPAGVTVGQRRLRKAADGVARKWHLHRVLDANGHRILRHQGRSGRLSTDKTSTVYYIYLYLILSVTAYKIKYNFDKQLPVSKSTENVFFVQFYDCTLNIKRIDHIVKRFKSRGHHTIIKKKKLTENRYIGTLFR